MVIKQKLIKTGAWTVLVVLIWMNIIAAFHAYKFTHFTNDDDAKTNNPGALSLAQKINTLIFGISNPRPTNKNIPISNYETIKLRSNKEIECWQIKTIDSKGTVVLFHGFGGEKSSMLDKAAVLRGQGYNVFLVDFMGSGGSEGNQTTIGFFEAEQVRTCFDYLKAKGESKIYLFGTSMGAVAIMKAINDYQLDPHGIIVECPFGTMYQTVSARFKTMNVPAFPMAALLVFWGGIENEFWAFGHNPAEYAKSIKCPTLLLYGARDEKVSRQEIDEIFFNLTGKKELKVYPQAGHENYLIKYRSEWAADVQQFLNIN